MEQKEEKGNCSFFILFTRPIFLRSYCDRDCAAKIVDGLRPLIDTVLEEPEIAGPGFINFKFKEEYLAQSVQRMAADPARLAVPLAS